MGKAAKLRQARAANSSWKTECDNQQQATRQQVAASIVRKAKHSAAQLRQQGINNPFVYLVENQPHEVAGLAKQMLEDEGNLQNILIVHESEFDPQMRVSR